MNASPARTRISQFFGPPFAHLFAHEHGIGADVNDPALVEQTVNQCFNVRINQGFAAANRDHRRITFLGRSDTILQRHHVFERGGIFADSTATGAGQVAGMQRLKLQHGSELLRATDLMADDVRSDLGGERQRKPHRSRTVPAPYRVST